MNEEQIKSDVAGFYSIYEEFIERMGCEQST